MNHIPATYDKDTLAWLQGVLVDKIQQSRLDLIREYNKLSRQEPSLKRFSANEYIWARYVLFTHLAIFLSPLLAYILFVHTFYRLQVDCRHP
jgi:hypothetical protein